MSASVVDFPLQLDDLDLRDLDVIDLREPVALAAAPSLELPSITYLRWVKPVIDRLGAALLLLVLLPLLLAAVAAIRLTMGPGVLFRQQRVGLGGVPFTVYKLRTMLPDRRRSTAWDGVDRRQTHKSDADPRHTPLGRFLRKWSIDELPQLVNVLRGEMSLVGPRPELVQVVGRYQPWEHARHAVRPGVTGLWQTRARSQGPMHLFTNMDLDYIRSVSFVTDLRILLATIPAALGAQKGR